VSTARLNLQYTRILAPATGRTGALLAHRGDLVQANANTPLVVINQVAPIYVSFAVPGKTLDDIRRLQRNRALSVVARVTGDEQDGTETGKLTFIDNAVDPQTGTIKLKATFANPARRLWPGQFAEITLQLRNEPRAIVVPSVAVQAGQQGAYVFVVVDGRAQMRPVSVARVAGEESVIASGLTAGDVVVTDGQLRLTPNARISVRGAAGGGRSGRAGAEAQ
jgi:multidrug efflux system membrane fusion protein